RVVFNPKLLSKGSLKVTIVLHLENLYFVVYFEVKTIASLFGAFQCGSSYVCSGSAFKGMCQNIAWPNFACKNLAGNNSTTMSRVLVLTRDPAPSTRETLLSIYTSLPAAVLSTYAVRRTAVEPVPNYNWSSYGCQTLDEAHMKTVGSAGPDVGSCMFYVARRMVQ
ncbi:hypothetical protein CI102_15165, partial [Trichoderma harzianum]